MKNTIGIILGVMVLLSACSPKIQFTQKIKDEHQISPEELKQLQFYTSGDIVLQRMQSKASEKSTTGGELVLKTGSALEQVIIKAGTPGIVVGMLDGNKFMVRFEPGENKHLVFGDPKNSGGYFIQPSTSVNGKKIVNYGDGKYMLSGKSEYVSLLFKMKKLNQFENEQRVVKGMKL